MKCKRIKNEVEELLRIQDINATIEGKAVPQNEIPLNSPTKITPEILNTSIKESYLSAKMGQKLN